MKLWISWKEVYEETKRGKDYVNPDFKFEWKVTEEEIKRFMTAMNPNFPYFISRGSECVEVIGKDEIDKHIEIFENKAIIRRLEAEIKELSK